MKPAAVEPTVVELAVINRAVVKLAVVELAGGLAEMAEVARWVEVAGLIETRLGVMEPAEVELVE